MHAFKNPAALAQFGGSAAEVDFPF